MKFDFIKIKQIEILIQSFFLKNIKLLYFAAYSSKPADIHTPSP